MRARASRSMSVRSTRVTGPGSIYGAHLSDIPNLAFKHIEAMGGPKFNLILKDNKSGDPQAGAQAVRELGFAISPDDAVVVRRRPRVRCLRASSSTRSSASTAAAVPRSSERASRYFWGSIATTPNDALPGMIEFVHRTMKDVYTLSVIGWDLGPLGAIVATDAAKYFTHANMVLGVAEVAKVGSTDYSASLVKIKASDPDAVMCVVYGEGRRDTS